MEKSKIHKICLKEKVMEEHIDIVLSTHARLDCMTLRYGHLFHSSSATFIGAYDDVKTQDQKPREIKNGNQHYVGKFIHSTGVVIEDIRLVLAKPDKYRIARTVISVLLSDGGFSDRGVTDLIRDLRQENEITPEKIVRDFHPLYISERIPTTVKLFTELVKMGIKKDSDTHDERVAEALARAKKSDAVAQDRDKRIIELIQKIRQLEMKNPSYSGEDIETAPICTLKAVRAGTRVNKRGGTIECTYFDFEENVPTRVMDAWCDQDGEKTRNARLLIGRRVMTTTWKPDIFPPLVWCRNLYEAW